jgi:hypothetical protein
LSLTAQDIKDFLAQHEVPETPTARPVQVLGPDAGSYTYDKLGEWLSLVADANPGFTYERGRTSKGDGYRICCPGDTGWPDGAVHSERGSNALTGSAVVWVENGHPRFSCRHAHCSEGAVGGKKTWKHLVQALDAGGAFQRRVLTGVSSLSSFVAKKPDTDETGEGYPVIDHSEECSINETTLASSSALVSVSPDGENAEGSETPRYPLEIWNGTDYAEFAEICSRDNYIPPEFLIEALKTVTGAVVGNQLSVPDIEGALPRFYTVLMGGAGSGKGTSISWASGIFKDINLGPTTLANLIWSPATKIEDVKWKNIGCCEEGFNSAPGMQRSNQKGQKRWLQTFEELDHMIEGSGIEGSGKALMGVNRQLYDREDFVTTTTGKRDAIAGKAQNTILAATTPQLWTDMFAGKSVKGSGLFQRFNLMVSEETRKKGSLRKPRLDVFKGRFVATIIDLDKRALEFSVQDEVLGMVDEWFTQDKFEEADGDVRGRLNVLAWRNALHLAWQRGLAEIGDREMADALLLSDYQFEVRRRYTPAEGESQAALVENKIRNFLEVTHRAHRKDIIQKLNLRRYGNFVIDRALGALQASGEIVVVEETTSTDGRGRKSLFIQLTN